MQIVNEETDKSGSSVSCYEVAVDTIPHNASGIVIMFDSIDTAMSMSHELNESYHNAIMKNGGTASPLEAHHLGRIVITDGKKIFTVWVDHSSCVSVAFVGDYDTASMPKFMLSAAIEMTVHMLHSVSSASSTTVGITHHCRQRKSKVQVVTDPPIYAVTVFLQRYTIYEDCSSPAGSRPVINTGQWPRDDSPCVNANFHGATHNFTLASYITSCEVDNSHDHMASISGINYAHTD